MGHVILIIGGTGSGKSDYGEARALALKARKYIYMATMDAHKSDEEMRTRIDAHQRRRQGRGWETVETPIDLDGAIREGDGAKCVILVDCLTMWITNLLLGEYDIDAARDRLIKTLKQIEGTVIFVTDEVGCGIVPEYALSRIFRDQSGALNRLIADCADEVYFVTAGLATCLKPGNTPPHASNVKRDMGEQG